MQCVFLAHHGATAWSRLAFCSWVQTLRLYRTHNRKNDPKSCLCPAAQWRPALCDPVDCDPPGSSVHEVLRQDLEGLPSSSRKNSLRKPPSAVFLCRRIVVCPLLVKRGQPGQKPKQERWKCKQRGPKLSGGREKGRGRKLTRRPVAPPPSANSPFSPPAVRTCTPTTASHKPELHPSSVVSHTRLEPQYSCPSPAAHACPGSDGKFTAGPQDGEAVQWTPQWQKALHGLTGVQGFCWADWPSNPKEQQSAP